MWLKKTLQVIPLVAIPLMAGGCVSHRTVNQPSPVDFTQTLHPGNTVQVHYALSDSTSELEPQDIFLRGRFEGYSLEEEWIGVRSGGVRYSVPINRIRSLSVLRDQKKPNLRMVGKGWLIGGAIAGIAGLVSLPLSDECTGWFCTSDQDAMIFLGIVAGVTTGVVGTVGGLLGVEETWEELNLPGASPRLLPLGWGRWGITLSLPVRR